MRVLLGLPLLGGLLTLALVIAVRRVRVGDRDIAWLAGGLLPTDPAVAEVYRRYLRRHRSHRVVGGWLGVLLALAYGATAQRAISFGVGAGGPLGDVLFCGLAGVVAGALSAEVYRLAARSGPALASLAPRPHRAHGGTVLAARLLLLAGLLAALVQALATGPGVALGAVLAGTVVVGMAEAARRAIADRRRPVLSPVAVEVDVRIRGYAFAAVARLELAAGALTAAWALGSTPVSPWWLRTVLTVATVGLLALALIHLHRARPYPPRTFPTLLARTGAVP